MLAGVRGGGSGSEAVSCRVSEEEGFGDGRWAGRRGEEKTQRQRRRFLAGRDSPRGEESGTASWQLLQRFCRRGAELSVGGVAGEVGSLSQIGGLAGGRIAMGVSEVGRHWRPGATSWWTATLLLALLSFSSQIGEIWGADSCGATNDATLNNVAANVSFTPSTCKAVWTAGGGNFILRFKHDDAAQTLNVIMTTPSADRWYGVGFNRAANVMQGTHAITFWVDNGGTPVVSKKYLSSTGFGGVRNDNGVLTYAVEPKVVTSTDTYYLSFVVNKPATSPEFSNMVLAVSGLGDAPTGSNFDNVNQHEATQNVVIDYSTGVAVQTAGPSNTKLHAHGIMNILGWGVLLPFGMLIARYGKSFDPAWFYAHAVSQAIGYIFVVAGFGLGLNLYEKDKGPKDLDTHRALGILLFVLATIQLSAGIIRPKNDSKVRRFWNWGHHWLGRSSLIIGAANIFFGIHVAGASRNWKVAYGVILAFEIALLIPLEVLYWLKLRKDQKAVDQYPGDHHQNGRRPDIESSAAPVFDGGNTWNDVKY